MIVLSSSNIYIYEIQIKVNNKVIAYLYVALFLLNKNEYNVYVN